MIWNRLSAISKSSVMGFYHFQHALHQNARVSSQPLFLRGKLERITR